MNEFNFTQWISIVAPLSALFYAAYRELRSDMVEFRTEMNSFRLRLDKNDERWLDTQTKILAIMSKLDMTYTEKRELDQ